MSIYESDATSSSFSLFGNNESSKQSESKNSFRSSRMASAPAPMGSTLTEAPNVVGLGRALAINTLTAAGFDHIVYYVTSGASSVNNDKVYSQSINDNIVALNIFQYIQPMDIPVLLQENQSDTGISLEIVNYDSSATYSFGMPSHTTLFYPFYDNVQSTNPIYISSGKAIVHFNDTEFGSEFNLSVSVSKSGFATSTGIFNVKRAMFMNMMPLGSTQNSVALKITNYSPLWSYNIDIQKGNLQAPINSSGEFVITGLNPSDSVWTSITSTREGWTSGISFRTWYTASPPGPGK